MKIVYQTNFWTWDFFLRKYIFPYYELSCTPWNLTNGYQKLRFRRSYRSSWTNIFVGHSTPSISLIPWRIHWTGIFTYIFASRFWLKCGKYIPVPWIHLSMSHFKKSGSSIFMRSRKVNSVFGHGKVDVGFVNQNGGFINQRFDNQGSTTKNGGFVNQGSSTKKSDSSTKRFVNQKSWIRQPKTADSSTKVRQPRFVNQGSSTKNTDSSTKDSSTKRLDSSTKNGGFINQGSSTKNTDSSTKDSSTKRLDFVNQKRRIRQPSFVNFEHELH